MDNLTLELNKIIKDLKEVLSEAVKRNPYDGLLFSGGLDTAVIAALNPNVVAVTVSLGNGAEDIYYSGLLAKKFGFKHIHYEVDVDEALAAVPEVIRILHSFDPALPNDLAAYFGLKKAKELGVSAIATGDASDELFGGYSFMQEMDDLDSYIRRITKTMVYSSNDIGRFLGLKIVQPFTDKEVVDFALSLPKEMKIRKEGNRIWGKWIVRKAFEEMLSKEVAWQSKRPLEYGSGMRKLRQVVSDMVSDEEFRERPPSIKFISVVEKEHFYYYKIYKRVVGEIPGPKEDEKACPGCGGGMERASFHCKICGYVLII